MEFISQHMTAVIVALIILTVIVFIAFYFWKVKRNYAWLDHWYSLPLIGRIARISKDTTRDAGNNAWTNSEKGLCADYARFINLPTRAQFDKSILYLKKAGDIGRSPVPISIAILLVVLVALEGMGFSYMLGSVMAMEASESMRQIIMIGMLLVLCLILPGSVHMAGHQLHRSNLLNNCTDELKHPGQPVIVYTGHVGLDSDQHCDDLNPLPLQCKHRVEGVAGAGKPAYWWGLWAIVLILGIAIGSTVMRVEHLKSATSKESGNLMQSVTSADVGNPFATGLPNEVTQVQSEADKKAVNEVAEATTGEGYAGFAVLALIFVATQIIGVGAGYRYGFAGSESKEAYKDTHGFSTYDALLRYIDPIKQVARVSLQRLQQKMAGQYSAGLNLHLHKIFDDYLAEEAARPKEHHEASYSTANVQSSSMPNTPSVLTVAQSNPVVEQKPQSTAPSIADHVAKVEAMGPGEDRQNYLASLSTDVLSAVQQMRKANKEAGAEDAKRRAELLKEDD